MVVVSVNAALVDIDIPNFLPFFEHTNIVLGCYLTLEQGTLGVFVDRDIGNILIGESKFKLQESLECRKAHSCRAGVLQLLEDLSSSERRGCVLNNFLILAFHISLLYF